MPDIHLAYDSNFILCKKLSGDWDFHVEARECPVLLSGYPRVFVLLFIAIIIISSIIHKVYSLKKNNSNINK